MTTFEMCPYCDEVHEYDVCEIKKNVMYVQCKTCKKKIILCSICEDMQCDNCKWERKLKKNEEESIK